MNLFKSSIRQLRHALNTTLNPLQFRQYVLRNSKNASLEERVAFDVFERPHYAYGVYKAALQAKALGIARISALEFGCAGGNGLVALESISEEVTAALGIQIDVYGFDIGEGLPRPLDFRDLPYAWKAGQFKMDIPKLKSKLAKAELVIGDVADTVGPFSEREELAPIGFASFDLDFYSSTAAAPSPD